MPDGSGGRKPQVSVRSIYKDVDMDRIPDGIFSWKPGTRTRRAAKQSKQSEPTTAVSTEVPIEPLVPFKTLADISRNSNIIPQCVDCMVVNCAGYGYYMGPVMRITSDTPEDVIAGVKADADKALSFFNGCNHDESFTSVRKRSREDLEIFGNSFWEIIRTADGTLSEIYYADASRIKLMPAALTFRAFKQKVVRDGAVTEVERKKKFRRFIQLDDRGRKTWFKEFGDDRAMSCLTGEYAETRREPIPPEELANELLWFKIPFPGQIYGIPRWLGTVLSALGSYSAEELNFLWFVNGKHIPLALLVSGGMLTKDTVKRLQEQAEKHRGVENAHQYLIIEAESTAEGFGDRQTPVGIDLKPLTETNQQDALFQGYDKSNRDKIRSSFRLPAILVGESQDYNRATAEAAIRVANAQVFDPEREEEDTRINMSILPEIGVVLNVFKTKSYRPVDPLDMSRILGELSRMGGVTPRIVSEFVPDILNRDVQLPKEAESWWNLPLALAQAYFQQQGAPAAPKARQPAAQPQGEAEKDLTVALIDLKKALEDA